MLTWEDADGDELAIGTDEHLALALDEMPGPLYKFKAQVVPGDSDDVDDDIEQDLCQLIMLKIKFEMHEQSSRLENRDESVTLCGMCLVIKGNQFFTAFDCESYIKILS